VLGVDLADGQVRARDGGGGGVAKGGLWERMWEPLPGESEAKAVAALCAYLDALLSGIQSVDSDPGASRFPQTESIDMDTTAGQDTGAREMDEAGGGGNRRDNTEARQEDTGALAVQARRGLLAAKARRAEAFALRQALHVLREC